LPKKRALSHHHEIFNVINDSADRRPWHREPFMWLVVSIPLLTVVAGLSTVVIAHRNKDPIVSDNLRKEGLSIQHDPARDLAAARIGASAHVVVDAEHLTVKVTLSQGEAPATLVALLSHSSRPDFDRLVPMTRLADGSYGAQIAALPIGHWYIELSPGDRGWRLRGEFESVPANLDLNAGQSH
jgi:hypothetical protein